MREWECGEMVQDVVDIMTRQILLFGGRSEGKNLQDSHQKK